MATFWQQRIQADASAKASGLAKWKMLHPVLELIFDGMKDGWSCGAMRDVLVEKDPKVLSVLGPFEEIFTVDLQYLCTGMKVDANKFVEALSKGEEPMDSLQHMNTSIVRFCLCLMKMNFSRKELRKVKARDSKRKMQKTENVLSKLTPAQQRAIRALPAAAFELTLDCMWPMIRTLLDSLTKDHLANMFSLSVATSSGTPAASLWRPILAQEPSIETRASEFMGKKIVVRPVKPRTALDIMRYFDGKGVDIFVPVDGKKTLHDLLKERAVADPTFLLAVEWMERAMPGKGPVLGPEKVEGEEGGGGGGGGGGAHVKTGGVEVTLASNLHAPFSRIPPRCVVDAGLSSSAAKRRAQTRQQARAEVLAGGVICNFCGKPGFQLCVEDGIAPSAVTDEAQQARLQRCSRCRKTHYCGRSCQVAHWVLGHKNDCRVDVTV